MKRPETTTQIRGCPSRVREHPYTVVCQNESDNIASMRYLGETAPGVRLHVVTSGSRRWETESEVNGFWAWDVL